MNNCLAKKIINIKVVRNFLIFIKKVLSRLNPKKRAETKKIYKNYYSKEKQIKNNIKINPSYKISVCFFVVYNSCFPAKKIFENMLNDSLFNPFIVVIPDVLRGKEHMIDEMNKTFNTLSLEFGKKVFKSFVNNKFIDYSDKIDIIISSNHYDILTHEYYTICYLIKKNILPVFIYYSLLVVENYFKSIAENLNSLKYGWLICSETKVATKLYKKYANKKAKIILSGYPKIDLFNGNKQNDINKKNIIIASHHTVRKLDNCCLELSNFLRYSQLFLKIPKLYKNINFIYRPHPLLIVTLKNDDVWGREKTDNYFKELLNNKNVILEEGGEYYKTFENSNALIDDCGSFLAEYFITGKPQCYMINNKAKIKSTFNKLGKKCLSGCYIAHDEKDIISFIDNVVIKNIDYLENKRKQILKRNLIIRDVAPSEYIVSYIKKQFITK